VIKTYLANGAEAHLGGQHGMIDKPTTLVLGAGASMPYGYPSGAALRQRLIDDELFSSAIQSGLLGQTDVAAFCQTFRYSGMPSIDAFLSRRGQHKAASNVATFELVGKLGIALALRKQAQFGGLFHKWDEADTNQIDMDDNWYEYLWVRLTDGVTKENLPQFGENKLKIVTFNYDTSLEQYLFSALKNAYGLDDVRAMEQLANIPIHHVYGRLTFGINELCPDPLKYGVGGLDLISDDADCIQVIDETRDDRSPTLERCYEALLTAERILFLGFGFDGVNVARLRVADALHDRYTSQFKNSSNRAPEVYCTTIGKTPWERRQVHRMLFEGVQRLAAEKPELVMHYAEKLMAEMTMYSDCKSLNLLRSTGALD